MPHLGTRMPEGIIKLWTRPSMSRRICLAVFSRSILSSWIVSVGIICLTVTAREGVAEDWPMWRYDGAHSGSSPEVLAETLHLQWTLELPTPKPAWPSNQEKLQFDRLYEPVVLGKTLFVGSMISDKLSAFDTETGDERWSYYVDGPVRFAPVATDGRVFFSSDDGYLYALNVEDGSLVWRFRGGPRERLLLGQDRLISTWPARGAPVLHEGTLYFGAGLFGFQGIFLYALDPATGSVIWSNTGSGSDYLVQQHGSPAFAGLSPQGYIAATRDRLVVSGGRTMPAVYDRHTGKFLHFDLSSRAMGSKGGGGYEVTAGETFYLNRDAMYRLDTGKFLARVGAPVVTEFAMIGADEGGLRGFKPGWEEVTTKDTRGEDVTKVEVTTSWTASLEDKIEKVYIQSGGRVYGLAAGNTVVAVDLPSWGRGARISWRQPLPDLALNMLTADGKLFVTTEAGRIYAFGGTSRELTVPPLAKIVLKQSKARRGGGRWGRIVRDILDEAVMDSGYAVVLGIGSGRLIEELLRQSDLQLIVVDPDPEQVEGLRRKLDAAGLYGQRVAARAGSIFGLELPPFLASVVVSEDAAAARLDGDQRAFVQGVFRLLRPYTGLAMFQADADLYATAGALTLDGGAVRSDDEYLYVTRERAPSGSGSWTHQYGDASNSAVSSDTRVKLPLGLLWFGGPSNEEVLPRHGHGPTPHVSGGRLIIEGRNMLRAVDVYTGRLLWQRDLPGLGEFYDYTSHEPGANLIGSNYVSLEDGIYVVYQKRCLRLNPVTGETVAEFFLPKHPGDADVPDWGYLAAWEDVLLGGAKPTSFVTGAYVLADGYRFSALAAAVENMRNVRRFVPTEKQKDETDWDWLSLNANRLLFDEEMTTLVMGVLNCPDDKKEEFKVRIAEQEQKLTAYLEKGKSDDHEALLMKREILHLRLGLPQFQERVAGRRMSFRRAGSRKLVARNRHTGEVLWEFSARHELRHNAIAVGNGRVYCMDRLSTLERSYFKRRGLDSGEEASIVALDIRTGEQLWRVKEPVFGTWLGYSSAHDALLQAGSSGSDRSRDEVGKGMAMFQGETGALLWKNDAEYSGPCLLLGDMLVTQGYRAPGFALDLLTGVRKQRRHPVSNKMVDWGYIRNYGCNTGIGAPNLLTFRSAAAGYYDLAGDTGTGNFGGFRAGCTTNLIPADGVLNAPDYTRTCSCSYQNQASLALVHEPEVERWTFSAIPYDYEPVRQVGLNFGAPGDRYDENGALWIDYPSVGGPSPDVPSSAFWDGGYERLHPSRLGDQPLAWVAASAFEGRGELVVQLTTPAVTELANEVEGKPALLSDNARLTPTVAAAEVPANAVANRSAIEKVEAKQSLGRVPHYDALSAGSLTVEYWVFARGELAHLDARGVNDEEKPREQGFVLEGRSLRARYFTAGPADKDGKRTIEKVVLETGERLPEEWAHVAFTYDAAAGVGSLWIDGKVVGQHKGTREQDLYWATDDLGLPAADWVLGAGESATALDELRVCAGVVPPEQFLFAKGGAAPGGQLGYWRMEPFLMEEDKPTYTVRLVFAEIGGKTDGERRFDVALQGETVLEGFDIAAAAGGALRTVIKEFSGVPVGQQFRIRLTPKGDVPALLSGLHVLREGASEPVAEGTSD